MMRKHSAARDRALSLQEIALEIVYHLGEIQKIPSHGIARAYTCPAFRIWYVDPDTSECDQFHHLDVWADRAKVLSVAWLPNTAPEVVTFKRGAWEPYFVA